MELIRVAVSNDDIDLKPFTKVLGAFLVAGSDNATATVYDAATQAGTDKFTLKALANSTSSYLNFQTPGLPFKTAISVTLAGTSPVLYLLVD